MSISFVDPCIQTLSCTSLEFISRYSKGSSSIVGIDCIGMYRPKGFYARVTCEIEI